MKARIQRLRAEIASDRSAVERHLDEIQALETGEASSAGDLARVALALHHAYTGIEAILLRVARALEGEAPSGPDWHKELLEEMGLDLPEVRPAILSVETIAGLRVLLAFRHFFRHAYTTELSPARLSYVRAAASDARVPLAADFDALDRLLEHIAAQP